MSYIQENNWQMQLYFLYRCVDNMCPIPSQAPSWNASSKLDSVLEIHGKS